MARFLIACLVALAACTETAWDTTIAGTADRRLAMAASVEPGRTTQTEFITRWGAPTQRVREGGQTEFIYRSMANPPGYHFPRFGESGAYVIVTFQYGRAVAVRTSETEGCRATFPPQPPGPGFYNPTTVHPAATCSGVGPPLGRGLGIGPARGPTGDGIGQPQNPPGVPAYDYATNGKGR